MNRLTEHHFSFKCPMSWDDMPSSANGRFCHSCRKEVFDLTDCSLDDVRALQEKHGSICGAIRVVQVAAVAISLSAAACKEEKPTIAGSGAPPSSPPTRTEPVAKPDAPPPVKEAPPAKDVVQEPDVTPRQDDSPPKDTMPPKDMVTPEKRPPVVMGFVCPPIRTQQQSK